MYGMDFEEHDKLKFQYLAGASIVEHPPVFSPGGEYLFTRAKEMVYVYSSVTGELARKLTGASSYLISMELEIREPETLVACSSIGEVLRWNWRSGRLQRKLDLKLKNNQKVLTFNLINFYGNTKTPCAFLTLRTEGEAVVKWYVVDTSRAERLNVPCKLKLLTEDPLVAADANNIKYIAIAQGCYIYFLNYRTWECKRLFNGLRVPITVVRIHPMEEAIATGDEMGRIFIWREFMDQTTVKTTLYHWHHTAVTSIAFTPSGTGFYSSGMEAVLVYWNIKRLEIRNFLPRMCSIIRHLSVNDDNTQVAVCTADNGVRFIGTDNSVINTLHEFTYIEDDKTGNSKFPIGLRLNPRTNTLVLNGRHGHLQFYSVYTKNLLYNMDIVMQNQLSMESDRVIYNICVTKAAFNIDWMATGEVFNDNEHLPELCLKFWKYDESMQTYTLNTNVDLPHEGGFKAIHFSNANQVDNLLCATVGEDNIIKMWSLEESDNIYKKGKVWYCIAQTNYRDLDVESISFSQDGSVLAAGYGNTLCIYRAENLKLKAALTPPAGFDGYVPHIQVSLRRKGEESSLKDEFTQEKCKKWMQLLNNYVENNDDALIREVDNFTKKYGTDNFDPREVPAEEIDEETKKILYNKIMDMHQLNFFHKVLLFQRLGIRVNVHPAGREHMIAYLRDTVLPEGKRERLAKMQEQLKHIHFKQRFKAKWRLDEYARKLREYEATYSQKLVPLMETLNLDGNSGSTKLLNGCKTENGAPSTVRTNTSDASSVDTDPLQMLPLVNPVTAQISHVQFATGESAHLVIVCTERRVLIYNLLTLRLQAACKLSVEHLAFDPQTNLVAVITKYNELYVFQPNVPIPIYQRRNVPRLYGAVWLSRRHPKNRSINVDWQAQSTLYFLTEDQEIVYLGLPDSVDDDAPPLITFSSAANETTQYTTFGTYATQQHSDMQTNTRQPIGPLVIGNSRKMAVKSLMEMSTHTMPPLSLIVADFVKSLLKFADSEVQDAKTASTTEEGDGAEKHSKSVYKRRKMLNGHGGGAEFMNGYGSHTDDEDEDEEVEVVSEAKRATAIDNDTEMVDEATALKQRRTLIAKAEEINANAKKTTQVRIQQFELETELKRTAALTIEIDF